MKILFLILFLLPKVCLTQDISTQIENFLIFNTTNLSENKVQEIEAITTSKMGTIKHTQNVDSLMNNTWINLDSLISQSINDTIQLNNINSSYPDTVSYQIVKRENKLIALICNTSIPSEDYIINYQYSNKGSLQTAYIKYASGPISVSHYKWNKKGLVTQIIYSTNKIKVATRRFTYLK